MKSVERGARSSDRTCAISIAVAAASQRQRLPVVEITLYSPGVKKSTGADCMNSAIGMSGAPKKILLATDLSPRCDRALDRALALTAEWESELVVLHALEAFEGSGLAEANLPSWRRPPDPVSLVRKQLRADVGSTVGKVTVRIEQGDPLDAIARVAEDEHCELIVVGTARNELLGRFKLGRTVDRLLRRVQIPVLVVKNRARGPYRQIVVATDFSDASRHALDAAARFFPEQKLLVFHGDVPSAHGNLTDSPAFRHEHQEAIRSRYAAFRKALDRRPGWQEPQVLIEDGPPVRLLRDLVRAQEVDLIVLGSQGRSMLHELLIGSVAKAMLEDIPCDALLVRAPQTGADA